MPRGNYGYPDIEGIVDNDLERQFAEKHHTIPPLIAWTPTIAPAGLNYYYSDNIPEWNHALLLVMLKGQGLRVLNLNKKGDKVIKEEIFLEKCMAASEIFACPRRAMSISQLLITIGTQ